MPSRTLSRHCCSCILAPTAASHSLCTRNRWPPCKGFTPKLSATYEKLKAAGKKLSVVFCSSDRDQKQFQEYFGSMPADWYAVPPGDKRKEQLSTLFEVQGIPSLVILDAATGETINANARGMVGKKKKRPRPCAGTATPCFAPRRSCEETAPWCSRPCARTASP